MSFWLICQIISVVLYEELCLEIIHYFLNQIIISFKPKLNLLQTEMNLNQDVSN